jgi:hypothetical protein
MVHAYGRHPEFDEQSRAYSITLADSAKPRTVLWRRHSPILDQGSLGSCTGNAMTGWLACEPHCTDPAAAAEFNEEFAVGLYSMATRLDRFAGIYPHDDTGSSGLAVAKAAKKFGLISAYRWAFSTRGLIVPSRGTARQQRCGGGGRAGHGRPRIPDPRV